MTDGSSWFTSDRRSPSTSSWVDETDWAAGSGGGVEIVGGELVGRDPGEFLDIPDSGVARWSLDHEDTDSGTALDSWGGYDAIINGATTGVSGANETYDTTEAYRFDGNNDYLVAPSLGSGFSAGFSFATWIKPTFQSSGDYNYIAQYGHDTKVWRFEQDDVSRGTIEFGLYNGSGWDEVATAEFPENTWSHLTGTFDGSRIVVYRNGSSVASGSGSLANDSGDQFELGSRFGGNHNWQGDMDDPRVYGEALSPSEVGNLYNTGSIYG